MTVSFDKSRGKWLAKSGTRHIGRYDSREEAEAALAARAPAMPAEPDREPDAMIDEPARKPVFDGPVRLRENEYRGRNGEILRREKYKHGNKYDFPDDIKETGWTYWWARHTVHGENSYSELATALRNGWALVRPDQLKGYFRNMVQPGSDCIEIDGLVLVERPKIMSDDAHEEGLRDANRKYHQSMQTIINQGMDQVAMMPTGVIPYVRGGNRVDVGEYEQAPSSWAPPLEDA